MVFILWPVGDYYLFGLVNQFEFKQTDFCELSDYWLRIFEQHRSDFSRLRFGNVLTFHLTAAST